jgi:phosphoribosylformylglycinamidine (FGAM) synthase-like enzyme
MVQCNCAEQAHKVWAAAYWSQVQQCRGHQKMRKEHELNIGLLVEKTGKRITRKDASAALAATGFEAHASILHEGEWEGQAQPTLVVVGFAPANWSADALADELQQDSIAVLEVDANHGRLDGPNPQDYAFDHSLFTTFEQAVDAECERRKRIALEDLEHARLFEAAQAKDASDKAFLAAVQPA